MKNKQNENNQSNAVNNQSLFIDTYPYIDTYNNPTYNNPEYENHEFHDQLNKVDNNESNNLSSKRINNQWPENFHTSSKYSQVPWSKISYIVSKTKRSFLEEECLKKTISDSDDEGKKIFTHHEEFNPNKKNTEEINMSNTQYHNSKKYSQSPLKGNSPQKNNLKEIIVETNYDQKNSGIESTNYSKHEGLKNENLYKKKVSNTNIKQHESFRKQCLKLLSVLKDNRKFIFFNVCISLTIVGILYSVERINPKLSLALMVCKRLNASHREIFLSQKYYKPLFYIIFSALFICCLYLIKSMLQKSFLAIKTISRDLLNNKNNKKGHLMAEYKKEFLTDNFLSEPELAKK